MKNLLCGLFVMCVTGLHGQWVDATLAEFSENLLASEAAVDLKVSYSLQMHYDFFNDLTVTTPELQMNGKIISDKGQTLYVEQFNQIMIQDATMNMAVDTQFRIITIQKPQEIYMHKKTMEELSFLLNSQCVVKKNVSDKMTKYSVEFAPGAYYKGFEIWYNSKKMVEKYILYGGQEATDDRDFYNPVTIQPRLEISYSNYKFGKETDLKGMKKISDFITVSEDSIMLVDKYKDYELVDLRIEN